MCLRSEDSCVCAPALRLWLKGKSETQRWGIVRNTYDEKTKKKKKTTQKNEGGREGMKNGRKEILRGEKRFLKDPKNDGNCGVGGWGLGCTRYWNREPSRSWLADAVPARQAECNVWLAWPHLGPVFGQGRHTHPHTLTYTHSVTYAPYYKKNTKS